MDLILFLPLFIVAVFLAFYVPGRVVLGKQKNLSNLGIFSVSVILGIVLWGWQGYVFGFLNLRWLSYVYLLMFLALFIRKKYFISKIPKINFKKADWISILIAVIGVIGQTIGFVRNGQLTSSGLFISNFNYGDHIWHATLTAELVKRFPPNEPGMSGVAFLNYHFWFHFVTAEIVRVFNLPLLSTQFLGMYVLAPVFLGITAYVFAKAVYNSKTFIRLLLFFLYFSGDAMGWLMYLLKGRFDLSVYGFIDDATNFIDNPARAFSVIIALAGMYFLFVNLKSNNKKNILVAALLFGSLVGFKIYMGIVFLLGLLCLAFFDALKRNFYFLWVFILGTGLSLAQFLPFNISSGGIFFLPFEIPRSFITTKQFGLTFFDQRWRIYGAHQNYLRLIEYGIIMTAFYFIVQFGVKILGLIPLKKSVQVLGARFSILLYSSLAASIIFGLFFYQKLGGANIWEFFYATSLLLAIGVSLNLSIFFSKVGKLITLILVLLIIIFTIPRWFHSVNLHLNLDYFSGFHGVSNSELNIYNFIKNNTAQNSLLLILGEKKYVLVSSIATILSDRSVFLSGSGVAQTTTPERARREEDVKSIEAGSNQARTSFALKNDKINYLVIYNQSLAATNSALLKNPSIKKIFKNDTAEVFKVD